MIKKTKTINPEIEKRILTGLIISDNICNKVINYIEPKHLEFTISQIIIIWIKDYYEKYNKALKSHVIDYYNVYESSIKPEYQEEIKNFLTTIVDQYIDHENQLNEDYITEQSLLYLKKQKFIYMGEEVKSLANNDLIDEAETVWRNSGKQIQQINYKWVSPFDDIKFINSVFDDEEEEFFSFSGALGKLVGPLKRGWLIGIMGAEKRGKTFELQDIVLEGLFNKKNVAYFTLEMKNRHLSNRFYYQLGSYGKEQKKYIIPCFDCKANQDNYCQLPIRTCRNSKPNTFDINNTSHYKPCTVCRGTSKFQVATWFIAEERPLLTRKEAIKITGKFTQQYGKNKFKMSSFPPFTTKLSDVERELDKLESEENFLTDILVIDHPRIFSSDKKEKEKRHEIANIWQQLKKIADERNCLVFAAVHSNREGIESETLKPKDTSEDISILANVDIMGTINQTEEEAKMEYIRFGLMEHRWKKFSKNEQVIILRQLDLGQPRLDSEIIYYEEKRNNKRKSIIEEEF